MSCRAISIADMAAYPWFDAAHAQHEELFDNRQNPELAHERAVGPKRYVVIPNISHYGVYGQARDQTMQLAIEWFDAHLKP